MFPFLVCQALDFPQWFHFNLRTIVFSCTELCIDPMSICVCLFCLSPSPLPSPSLSLALALALTFTLHLFFLSCFPSGLLVTNIVVVVVVVVVVVKSLQSCPTLCDPIDGSPPGSPVPGIPQARTPEWAAISFSNAWKWKVKVKSLSRVRLLATPWTAAYQAPPSMGFSRQEYWSGVSSPSPLLTLARVFLLSLQLPILFS